MNIEYNMRGVLHAFFRQKVKFALFTIVFAVLGFVYTSGMVAVYEAQGSMLVKFGQGALPEINTPDKRTTEVSRNNRSEIMQSNLRILQSRNLLNDVAEQVGLARLAPAGVTAANGDDGALKALKQRVVGGLSGGGINVTVSGGSNLIDVAYTHTDPQVAAVFVDRLMDLFIVRQAALYNTAQTSFLGKQVEGMRLKLEQSRAAFSEFKREVGVSEIDEEMRQLLVEKRELSNVAFQSVSNAQTTLSALEAQAAELRESIAVARAQLGDRQNDLGSSGDDDGSLSNKIDQIDQRIAWLEEKRGRYNELSQRVKMDEDNFQYYQQRGEEARVNMLLNAENITRVSIVDQAVVPNKPSGPSKKLILIAFLMAGMLLGLCAALGFELLDDRLTTPDALAAASGLPVLAAFGKVRG